MCFKGHKLKKIQKKKRTINSAMIARNVLVCFWPSLPSLFWFKEFSLCRNLASVLCLVYVAGGYFYKNLYIGMISVHFDSEQLAFCLFTCKMKQPRYDSLTSRLPVSFKWDTIWDSVLQTGKNKPSGRKHTRGNEAPNSRTVVPTFLLTERHSESFS